MVGEVLNQPYPCITATASTIRFESGSMPYAQQHYPFENKEKFEGCFPADFIAEGLDQTR
jgi:hypothetical protein